jgi:hypothetical protein
MSQRYAGGMITANQTTVQNYSGLFNGSSNYLSLAGAAQYALAASTPFTVEAWVNPTVGGSVIFTEGYSGVVGNKVSIVCSLATSNDVSVIAGLYPAFGWYNGSSWVTAAVSTVPLLLNAWSHVAFVYDGAIAKIYVNGVDVTSPNSPLSWGVLLDNGDGWYIGRKWDQTGGNIYFRGYISNLRFVNGTAVYTANFAPPTRLSAIPNTVLLTCQSPTFVDNSVYAATITNNAGVINTEVNPFYTLSSPALGAATPGVWTLSQATEAAAKRSWNMYDPEFNLVTGMIHGNGTNGATNNTFLDSSSNNFSVTRNGNTAQGTFTPFSWPNGYWSNYFDGTGDYLTVPDNAALEFGTSNFCVEMWVYPLVVSGTPVIVTKRASSTGTGAPVQIYINAGTVTVGFSTTGGNLNVGNVAIGRVSDGNWYHIAAYRVGDAWYAALNGVVTVINANFSGTSNNNASAYVIGGDTNANYFTGYISNYRTVVGSSVYTATSFTPPTEPAQPISGTQLLTCQSNRFVDNSPNNFPISKFADARTIAYQPFYPPYAYRPEANGGAMYFDGTGDYLTVADNAALEPTTNQFCIEALFYTSTVAAGTAVIVGKRATSAGFGPILIARSTATITVSLSSNNSSFDVANAVSLGAITTNQWYHVAVYRVGNAWYGSLNGVITTVNPSFSSFLADTADAWVIGADTNGNGFNGDISNVRFVIGSSVYTSGSAPYPTTPFTPTSSANTQLLLSGTNSAIFDNASNLIIETVNASISTAQNKYGSGTIAFNGTNAYAKLISPFASGTNYGPNVIQTRGDFTVEAWVNPTNTAATRTVFYINGGTGSYASVRLDITTSGTINFLCSFNNTSWSINTTSTATIQTVAWSHIAVVRAGPSIIVYLNGVAIITSTVITMANTLYVGLVSVLGAALSTNYLNFFNGYISDFRVTNYARYMGNFTPPTSTLQNQ